MSVSFVAIPLLAISSAVANSSSTSSAPASVVETPQRQLVSERSVDLVELNHFIDENGREVFRQVVFYDWSKRHRRFHVRGWRLIKTASQLPKRSHVPNRYVTQWIDNGSLRRVHASQLRETWTQHDPERQNRKFLPEDKRRPLWPK